MGRRSARAGRRFQGRTDHCALSPDSLGSGQGPRPAEALPDRVRDACQPLRTRLSLTTILRRPWRPGRHGRRDRHRRAQRRRDRAEPAWPPSCARSSQSARRRMGCRPRPVRGADEQAQQPRRGLPRQDLRLPRFARRPQREARVCRAEGRVEDGAKQVPDRKS